MRPHHDQVSPDLIGHADDLGRGCSFAQTVFQVELSRWDIDLTHFPLERVVVARVSAGGVEGDGRLAEIRRLFRLQVRLDDVEQDQPGVVLDGQSTGHAKGVHGMLGEVGCEQDGSERLHDRSPRVVEDRCSTSSSALNGLQDD